MALLDKLTEKFNTIHEKPEILNIYSLYENIKFHEYLEEKFISNKDSELKNFLSYLYKNKCIINNEIDSDNFLSFLIGENLNLEMYYSEKISITLYRKYFMIRNSVNFIKKLFSEDNLKTYYLDRFSEINYNFLQLFSEHNNFLEMKKSYLDKVFKIIKKEVKPIMYYNEILLNDNFIKDLYQKVFETKKFAKDFFNLGYKIYKKELNNLLNITDFIKDLLIDNYSEKVIDNTTHNNLVQLYTFITCTRLNKDIINELYDYKIEYRDKSLDRAFIKKIFL